MDNKAMLQNDYFKSSAPMARRPKIDWKEIYTLNLRLGFTNLIKGVDYFRMIEYPLAISYIEVGDRYTFLDVGSSGSVFPIFLASKGHRVYAIDIAGSVLKLVEYAKRLGTSNLTVDVQDVTKLPYPDNFFDRITAISTLEHVLPLDNGDVKAVREMARTLKYGGQVIITVPYGEKFESIWSRSKMIGHLSLIRRYNMASLHERLVRPSGLQLASWTLIGELAKFSKVWYNSPFSILAFSSPFFAKLLIDLGKNVRNPEGILLLLKKA